MRNKIKNLKYRHLAEEMRTNKGWRKQWPKQNIQYLH